MFDKSSLMTTPLYFKIHLFSTQMNITVISVKDLLDVNMRKEKKTWNLKQNISIS